MAQLPHAGRYRRRNFRTPEARGPEPRPRRRTGLGAPECAALGLAAGGALDFLALSGHPHLAALIAGAVIAGLFFR